MTIQLTILGLGQTGSSVGLALGKYHDSILRVGHDRSPDARNTAAEQGAVDRTSRTFSGAVKNADILFLALPFHEVFPTLEEIAPDLKEDVLVLDATSLKNPVISWVKEIFPAAIDYVGLLPVINAQYLGEVEHGPQTASADLFQDSLMAVTTSQTASQEALDTAVNFIQLLGAVPYFVDPDEIDGVVSMTHLLPKLLAAVMLEVSQEAPGWREGRKIAGKAYTQLTHSFGKEGIPASLAAEITYNQENVNRLINDLIRCLVDIRDGESSPGEGELADRFYKLQQARDRWLSERQASPWIDSGIGKVPPRENLLSRLLGFRKPKTKGEDL